MWPNEGDRPARKTVHYDLGYTTDIQIQATGYVGNGAKRRNFEVPGHWHHDPIPMASRTGSLMQSSGISGLDPVGGKAPSDLNGQITHGLGHLRNLMKEAGGTLDDIITITILVRDLDMAPKIEDRLAELFPDPATQPALKFVNYRMPGSSHVQFHVTALIDD
jgi:2-iminobutanoate/2-iminopropanoate deaminase